MKTKLGLLLVCVLCAFSCMSTDVIKGNRNVVTKTIAVDNFTEIYLGSNIETKKLGDLLSSSNQCGFNYTQTTGDATLEVRIDENLFDLLEIEQDNGKLTIRSKNDRIQLRPSQFSITGSSKDLRKVGISGCMDFIADSPVHFQDVSFNVSGVGNLKLSDLTADKVRCDLSGVGKVYLTGQIKEGEFGVSGVGHIYAFDCPIEKLECDVSGVGGMEVNVTKHLDANTSGVGSIKYKGNPESLNKSATGVGRVKQVD